MEPTSNLDQALHNLAKVHADILELARSTGAMEGSPSDPVSGEGSNGSGATSDEIDADDDGPGNLADLDAAGLGPDAVAALVRKEMQLLDACWRRLLSPNSSGSLIAEGERLKDARRELDQKIHAAQNEEKARRDDALGAWLASSSAKADALDDPIWDGVAIKPRVDEAHGSFLDASRNIPRPEATHGRLMAYVHKRLRLLLNFVADLTQYTKNGAEPAAEISMDGNLPATLQEFEEIVKSLPRNTSQMQGLRHIRRELARIGKHVADANQRCWLSLERPDLYCNRYPGLSRLKDALLFACSKTPEDAGDMEKFSLLFARVVAEEKTDPQTLAFLGRNCKSLRIYMDMATNRDDSASSNASPSDAAGHDERLDAVDSAKINFVSRRLVARDLRGAAELTRVIKAHSSEISRYVDEFTQAGFPLHWSELFALMSGFGIKLTEDQLAVVPDIMKDVELRRSWFFSRGEAPEKFKDFSVNSKSTIWFRGRPAATADEDAAEGWCQKIMRNHPQGLRSGACIELIRKMAPNEIRGHLTTYWGYWRREKFVLNVANEDRWIPNPEFLCRTAAATLRRDTGIDEGRIVNLIHEPRHVSARSTAELKKEITHQSQLVDMVIEKLQSLYLKNEIQRYYRRDMAGLAFDRPALRKMLRQELGLSVTQVNVALGDLRPAELHAVAEARQWKKERWNFDEISNVIKKLREQCPFFVFMSQSFITSEINRFNPDRYMPYVSFGDFTRVSAEGAGDAAAAIKGLVDREEVGYFYQGSTSAFVCPAEIQNYLVLHDVFVSTSKLGVIFDEFSSEIIRQRPKFSERSFSEAAMKKHLASLVKDFNLQRGSPLPDWESFISYYVDEICGGVRPYFGRKAGEFYVILRNWLADDPVELKKFGASAKKRKTPPTNSGTSTQAMASTAKKPRRPGNSVSNVGPAPTASAGAWGPVVLPPGMPTNFAGFLAQYQNLPRTMPSVQVASSAATSGGMPLAASLQAGFRGTATAHFVDMRSQLAAAGLVARRSPGNGDCLFTALLTDEQLSTSQAQAMRRQVAVALHGTPDTAAESAKNAREIANYLFQRDEHNGSQQSLGIDEVPNRVRAGLEVLDGIYSDADLTIPLFCRLLDERAPPGTPPANVMLLSEMDGHVVIFTAADRTAIPLRHLSAVELQQTLRDLCAASAAMVILTGAHFDRVQPM